MDPCLRRGHRRRMISIPQTVSSAHAGVSCRSQTEPAGRNPGMRRRSGGGKALPRNLEPQILPMGIALRDQIYLVLPAIGFEGFLTRNRCADLVMQLITDERLAAMFLREFSENAFTVLPDALDKVGRDPLRLAII